MRPLQSQLCCSVLVIFVIFGVTSTFAISTGKKVIETDASVAVEEVETAKDALPSPLPSPSPSTSASTASESDDTEFASRLGTTTTTNITTTIKSKKKLLESSIKLKPSPPKFKPRNKKSSSAAAASFKSSQVAFPENEATRASLPLAEESESLSAGKGNHQQHHHHQQQQQQEDPVQLELLDDNKEGREVNPDSPENSEERGKYPRIYYGEADPPQQHPSYISAEEEEERGGGGPLRKSHENGGDHQNPKYFYPKNYVQNKQDHKRSQKNKKKYEYKYAEDVRQLEDPYRLHHQSQSNGDAEPPTQQPTPDSQYHGPDQYLKENADEQGGNNGGSPEYGGYGQNQGGGGQSHHYGGHYHGRDAAEIISKALHLLLPSALLLTGLSAVFPNRIHVPTNDRYYINNNNNIHRQKRSIDTSYNYGQPNEMLEPEHRSMSEEITYPEASYRNYNFEIGSPRDRKYASSMEDKATELFAFKDFKEIPTSAEDDPTLSYIRSRKTSGYIRNHNNDEQEGMLPMMMMSRGPQNPEEFDLYHQNHDGGQPSALNDFTVTNEDSSFAPSSIPTPTIVAPAEHSLNSVDYSPPQRPKRKMRTRTKIKVRQPSRVKSRPLPPPTTSEPISNINDFQSQLIGSEKIPHTTRRQIMMNRSSFRHQDKIDEQHAKGDFRLGDAFLKSIVEQHETEKATTSKPVDLSPDGAVMGLISSYAQHDQDSPMCQKKALCELAIKGKNPNATKFETFLWSLASLVPEQFSKLYELDDIFKAVNSGSCEAFRCARPNLDLQV